MFKKILVPIDGSNTSNKALDYALKLAQADQADVRLIYCIDELSLLSSHAYSGEMVQLARESGHTILQSGMALASAAKVKADTRLVDRVGQRLGESVADEAGNWGADLTLFVKALNDAGLKLPLYTYYSGVTGTPTALAAGGEGEVYVIAYGHSNHSGEIGKMSAEFKKKFNDDYYTYATYNGINLLSNAFAKAKSTDPVKVAAAMEGLSFKSFAGEVTMRKTDHQLQQSLFVTKWQKADAKNPYSVENTGFTFAPVKQMEPYIASTPTSCDMKRPS